MLLKKHPQCASLQPDLFVKVAMHGDLALVKHVWLFSYLSFYLKLWTDGMLQVSCGRYHCQRRERLALGCWYFALSLTPYTLTHSLYSPPPPSYALTRLTHPFLLTTYDKSAKGHIDIVKYLLRSGAAVDRPNKLGGQCTNSMNHTTHAFLVSRYTSDMCCMEIPPGCLLSPPSSMDNDSSLLSSLILLFSTHPLVSNLYSWWSMEPIPIERIGVATVQ